MNQPLVSIVLSVKDGESTLPACLESIEGQTYPNWELVCINDGSQDATAQALTDWHARLGDRLRVITHEQSRGLTRSLNDGLRQATGELIARIDADDTWKPEKLSAQVSFLQSHPTVGVVGTWYRNQRRNYARTYVKEIQLPQSDTAIKKLLWRRNPFGHSCVLMRSELLKHVNGYDESLPYAQDRDLWFRLVPLTRFANIPEVLVDRTVGPTNKTKQKQQMHINMQLIAKYARLYNAPASVYLGLVEPALVYTARSIGI